MIEEHNLPIRKGKVFIEGEDQNGEWIQVEFFKFDSTHTSSFTIVEERDEVFNPNTKQVENVHRGYSLSIDVELFAGGSPDVGCEAEIYRITRKAANS